jgi:hypothetical protein
MANVPGGDPATGGSPSESPSASSSRASDAGGGWYVSRAGKNQQEGPFTLAVLKEHAASGNLLPGDLVWQQGLAGWTPAKDVPSLQFAQGASSPTLQPVLQPEGVSAGGIRKIVGWLTHPMFFFFAGLASALLAVLTLVGSLGMMALKKGSWFEGAVLFLLMFFFCEAACGVLDILRRTDRQK